VEEYDPDLFEVTVPEFFLEEVSKKYSDPLSGASELRYEIVSSGIGGRIINHTFSMLSHRQRGERQKTVKKREER
jgi:hypothetical protein